jgi:hypothetical protein
MQNHVKATCSDGSTQKMTAGLFIIRALATATAVVVFQRSFDAGGLTLMLRPPQPKSIPASISFLCSGIYYYRLPSSAADEN